MNQQNSGREVIGGSFASQNKKLKQNSQLLIWEEWDQQS